MKKHAGKIAILVFLIQSSQVFAEGGQLPPVGERVYEVKKEGAPAKIHQAAAKDVLGFRDPNLAPSKDKAKVEVVVEEAPKDVEPEKRPVKSFKKLKVAGKIQRPQVAFDEVAPAQGPVEESFNQDFMDRSYRVVDDRGF